MATINELDQFDATIHELALTDPVVGGPLGASNKQAKGLANRTTWLKARVDHLLGTGASSQDVIDAITSHITATDPHTQYAQKEQRTTITVGNAATDDYSTIQAAWDSLAGLHIVKPLTIKVADGFYDATSGIAFDSLQNAQRIRIEGNILNPDLCQVNLGLQSWSISRTVIGLNISGFSMHGTFDPITKKGSSGLGVYHGAVVYSDTNSMKFYGCSQGIDVDSNAVYYGAGLIAQGCLHGAVSTSGLAFLDDFKSSGISSGDGYGVLAQVGGVIRATNLNIDNHHVGVYSAHGGNVYLNGSGLVNNCYYGYLSNESSSMMVSQYASVVFVADACTNGFVSQGSSSMLALNCIAKNCTNGFYALQSATMNAESSISTNNTNAYIASHFGTLFAWSTQKNNTGSLVPYNPVVSTVVGNLSGQVMFS